MTALRVAGILAAAYLAALAAFGLLSAFGRALRGRIIRSLVAQNARQADVIADLRASQGPEHSGCANTIGRLSAELADESHVNAVLRRWIDRQEDELEELRGDRPLHTPETLAFDDLIEREFPS